MTPDGTDSLSTAQENTTTRMEPHPSDPPVSGRFSEGKPTTEQKLSSCPAKKKLSEPVNTPSPQQPDRQTDWCYIYLHNRRIEAFQTFLNEKSPFQSFVLKAHPLRKEEHSHTPQQLILGGIVFIQGTPEDVQRFFKDKSLSHTLVRDCATQRPAILSDEIMRPLRQVVELASERISFLPKPFAHYAEGHELLRVVQGPLKGLEGCILRINKDRKLVMKVGQLTLALARAHREIFEPVTVKDDQSLQTAHHRQLTYLQEQLDKNLFFPQTQAEVQMYADNVALLIDRATRLLQTDTAENNPHPTPNEPSDPHQELSTDILLFLLEEIIYHFDALYLARRFDLKPIQAIGHQLTATIHQLTTPTDPRLSDTEKERLSTKHDTLTLGKEYLFQSEVQ